MDLKILDCTLRDGGYYTNWDFENEIVNNYFNSMNDLPVDYLEIGYRSIIMDGYYGEFFYCPNYLLKRIKSQSNKKIAVILNEKDIQPHHVEEILGSCTDLIDMVRLAVDPKNFTRAISLAKEIKKLGYSIAFNVMYMSKWREEKEFINELPNINGVADYLYLVDSFGGVFPEDVKEIISLVQSKTDIPLGFHGHNNLELALINTLKAIECGVSIVDSTITGMGRGAGNLKTELLLPVLKNKYGIDFKSSSISKTVSNFEDLQNYYKWGTNFPYILSGINSLPQKEVMSWVGKNRYSLDTIINALDNRGENKIDNLSLPKFSKPNYNSSKVLLVGGGKSVTENILAIEEYLKKEKEISVILSSARYLDLFKNLSKSLYICLVGNGGEKLNKMIDANNQQEIKYILPPYPRDMGTFIPKSIKDQAFELKEISIVDKYKDSPLSISFQLAKDLNINNIELIGFDGYDTVINDLQFQLAQENQYIINAVKETFELKLLTPSRYKNINQTSIFSLLR